MKPAPQFWRDPAMPHVESRRAWQSRACYRPHSHPTFSIGAVDEGTSVFTGAAEGPVVLRPGSLVLVPPARVHACNPAPGSAWSYQMLHLDARWLQRVLQAQRPQAQALERAPIRVSAEPAYYQAFCRLNALLFSTASIQEKEAALLAFVARFCRLPAQRVFPPRETGASRQRLRPVLDTLRQSGAEMRSLQELADMAGLSRYQMIRMFRAATGLTPHAWQLNQAINQARTRLQAGDALADVAADLGFADQSHFQRIFKAHTGTTPGRYRD
ncbi:MULTISPECIES: AraC family transcriptional regulator [Pseudoxanthomonas]|uniref:AraC-like DNA-binding protein n=1 Tax=Pseudoxanthomonas winnipegensis TaxID=2480810 RepID=A0AAW8G7P7_9GAMM|nr:MULTISPECIES: AraC family transcriptional regulator [Pseudoxanthomonas]MDQ1118356.1 AraC-like DNA-binding protein [Pseudoxanthomonas winnipegensis]MDQ1131538.1 AraC-like DNA-binding protein [Pseudoxanthomonas winnipegensis]MDR6138445.1 AraC-like DNA-binding protein [Pseudoxanthomonas sp. SORGH_AS_0997]